MKVKLSQTAPVFQVLSADLVLVALRKPPAAGPGARLLRVKPGRAFPPTHPTSRLCLELLQEHLSAGPGTGVLDVGCGAGILGLAAAALGAPLVLCLDIAGQAARTTLENARENGLAGRLRVVRGSTECIRRTFGLVTANLPWETQMAKAPEFSRLATPDGALILSGFRDNQEHLLKKLYHQEGWSVAHRRVRDFRHPELPPGLSFTWVAWVLRPREPGPPARTPGSQKVRPDSFPG